MVDLVSMGSDVVAGATALGGLELVFLGNVVADFNSYGVEQQDSVRSSHRPKALWATLGVVACLLSTGAALLGKWTDLSALTYLAALILFASLGLGCFLAYQTFTEID